VPRAIGADSTLVAGLFGVGGHVVPSVRLASWNFTGGAKG